NLAELRAPVQLFVYLVYFVVAPIGFGQSASDGFDPNVNDIVDTVALQTDGKIVIAGSFTAVGGTNLIRIARLNVAGSLDTTFNPAAGANAVVLSLAVQPDGKILVGGLFSFLAGQPRDFIGRLNIDGTLDTGFN